MKKLLLGASALLLSMSAVYAQDVHFTQYFSSPLTLNPALTGLVNNDLRVAANYRTQWSSVSSTPFTTATASYDMSLFKDKLTNGDRVGVGVLALYDKSGAGALTNLTFGFSAAYHKALGVERRHTVSLGVQGSLVQKRIDVSKLTFGSQFDPATGGINPNMGQENIGNTDVNYPTFAAGITYTGQITDNSTAYAGFSTYHLNTPAESFFSDNDSVKIHRRYTASLGGSFRLNENIYLYASGLYQQQAKASELMIGGAVGFVLNPGYDMEFSKATILYAGAWYRNADAICPYIGLDFKKATLGLSYDVNVSSFAPATGSNGGYELSLIFNGSIKRQDPNFQRNNFACPKF
jgi:type IX secretion system PorP/SprF family membrane protein